MYCSAFDGDKNETVAESTFTKGELTDAYHKTVVVTFKLSTRTEDSYLGNYELMIATVEEADINTTKNTVDWTKADYSTTDKASKCAGATSNYTFPGYLNAESPAAGKYFVLKDGNDVFALKSANFFTDDEDRNSAITATEEGKIEVTVNQDDTFFVDFGANEGDRPEGLPVVATTADSLELAFDADYAVANTTTGTAGGKTLTVNVGADIDLGAGKSFSSFFEANDESSGITDYVVDLGGHKITDASADRFIFDAAGTAANTFKANTVTLKNGTIDFKATAVQLAPGSVGTNVGDKYATEQERLEYAGSVSLIKPTGDVDLTLDGMTVTTSVGTAIYAAASGNSVPTVTVKNSTITAGGAYAISTNASGAKDNRTAVVVKVIDSTLTAGTPTTYSTNGTVKDRGIPARLSSSMFLHRSKSAVPRSPRTTRQLSSAAAMSRSTIPRSPLRALTRTTRSRARPITRSRSLHLMVRSRLSA